MGRPREGLNLTSRRSTPAERRKAADAIRADMAVAQEAGDQRDAELPLALSDPKDQRQVKGLTLIRGAMPFSNFKTEIDKALAGDSPAK
jgi:hypothetical protein